MAVKVAVYQGGLPQGVDENAALLESVAAQAEAAGVELVLFCELFSCGYFAPNAAATAEVAGSTSPDSFFARASSAAKKHRVALAYGYAERGAGQEAGKTFNSVCLVDETGSLRLNYRKTHVYAEEKKIYTSGDAVSQIIEWHGFKIAFLICYDVEFPEAVRLLALRGAELLLVPTALTNVFNAEITVRSRAFESQVSVGFLKALRHQKVFLLYANRCGKDPFGSSPFCGRSVVIAPDGRDLARAPSDAAGLFPAVIDKRDPSVTEARARNTYFKDRRPELYV